MLRCHEPAARLSESSSPTSSIKPCCLSSHHLWYVCREEATYKHTGIYPSDNSWVSLGFGLSTLEHIISSFVPESVPVVYDLTDSVHFFFPLLNLWPHTSVYVSVGVIHMCIHMCVF